MFCISLNYKNADVDTREMLSFDEEQKGRLFSYLKEQGIESAVYLSTCNRCELYGVGELLRAITILAELSNIDEGALKERMFLYTDLSAINHLFAVTSGMDSMVKGEDEILGQVKRAFEESLHSNRTDYELNQIFKSAITCAKKIKTDTKVSKTSVSISTIAASVCHRFAMGRKQVLVIGGSGEIGGKTIQNLLSYDEFDIYCTSRNTRAHADRRIRFVDYAERYDYLDRCDIVISATRSPHFTLVRNKVEESIAEEKPRLLIDLAVPRDIDKKVEDLSYCKLLSIDDFEKIAEQNNTIKEQEFLTANEIIEEEKEELLKSLSLHRILPILENNEIPEFKRLVFEFRDHATAEEFKTFVNVIQKMYRA